MEVRAAEPGEHGVGEVPVVAREHRDRGVLQEEEEADRREDLRERIALLDAAHELPVDQHTERVHRESHRDDRHERVEPEGDAEPPRPEHPEHQELAVGEVDHLHQTPDDREPHGDERIEEAHLESVDDRLE